LNAKHPITIAVMGCEVNGPGEAKNAYIGIAAGKGSGVIFKKGKVIKRVKKRDFVKEIIKNL
ncbi:MAG: flavodoxin-dependent (E)-4-hydroxy-3-methylbut-2-enyl-diphosphate synthase, partial [Candidatus Omnitrophica bacterium]|nr:flavodoxin-dependent (E)-4-hydroxy-3-methylbut-2-enyl-diphosphate synthase [Candidatus Omnitrophota bacterium]